MNVVSHTLLVLLIFTTFGACNHTSEPKGNNGDGTIGWGRVELVNMFYHGAPPAQEALFLSAVFMETEPMPEDDDSYETTLETPNGVTCDVYLREDTISSEFDDTQYDAGEIRAGTDDDYLSIIFSDGEYSKDVRIVEIEDPPYPDWMDEPDAAVAIDGLGSEKLEAFTIPVGFGDFAELVVPQTSASDVLKNSDGNYEISWNVAEEPDSKVVNFFFNVQMGNHPHAHFRCFPENQTNEITFPGDWISTWSSYNVAEIWIDSVNEKMIDVNGAKIVAKSTRRIYTSGVFVE